jgi:hypothetical protein
MNLNENQELQIKEKLVQLGAKAPLLYELHEHWCVQVCLEMNFGLSYEDAKEKLYIPDFFYNSDQSSSRDSSGNKLLFFNFGIIKTF